MEQILLKGVKGSGLIQVQRQVNKNGKTFTQHFWVKPGDVKSTDVVLQGNTAQKPTQSAPQPSQPSTPKSQMISLLATHGRDTVLSYAEAQGITWKKNDHEGINWMRASMAIQKDIQTNPSRWQSSSLSNQQPNSQPNQADNQSKPTQVVDSQPTDTKPQNQQNKTEIDTKKKVQELLKTMGDRKSVMKAAKDAGINWSEHTHEGVNWMRASMAIQKALKENPNIMDSQQLNQKIQATEKKVKQLEDLVSQLSSPSAAKVADSNVKSKTIFGIDTDAKSAVEKKKFGDVIQNASPENLRNYRTLGMCAGDKDSEVYLNNLYKKYAKAMSGTTPTVAYNPNIDDDPLRNKLQGVVNKMVVGVVKSSLKNARKRSKDFTMQQKLLEPWVDPNMPLSDAEIQRIKTVKGSGTEISGARQRAYTETDGSHKMMHRVLDKFKMSKEYGQLAEEYDKILTEFDSLTLNSPLLQTATNGNYDFSTDDKAQENGERAVQYEIDRWKRQIEHEEKWMADLSPGGTYHNPKVDWQSQVKKRKEDIKEYQETISKLETLKSQVNGKDLHKAAKLREQLFDPKFTDLNVNLYHNKQIGSQLAYQYFIKKDFVSEYPILSKENLDKLDKGDEESLTNLALYAGMFKPSLSKDGKSAKDALMDKFSERQSYLDAYGGVTQVVGNQHYAENNEIKCKISKASSSTAKKIASRIEADWDKQNHGHMRYKIKGVYEISGLAMEKDFDKIKKEHEKYKNKTSGGKRCDTDMFYHGTGSMATSLILGHSGEFKIVKAKVGRMLGDGIYLADKSSKSAQYIGDEGYARSGIQGSLMLVEASLGNTLQKRTNQGYNYDTVFAGTQERLLNNEWCVHDTKAVIPRYLVEMEVL